MIKIFNHYFHKRTLFHIIFDLGLVTLTTFFAIYSQSRDSSTFSSFLVLVALALAAGVVVINAGLGFYQRVYRCTLVQTQTRALLSLCLSLALAYSLFYLSALPLEDEQVFGLSLVAGVVLMLLHRSYVAHARPTARMRQRVLVYGSGAQAWLVGKTLVQADPHIELVGYYAGPNEAAAAVPAGALLPSGQSLTDLVRVHRVDEIVVALSERRGGSMPLRELLDCKMQGVRVVDLATHFEKTLGQIRRDAVSVGWLVFGDGFEQGRWRALVKQLFDLVCASLLIVLALPVMLLTAFCIRLDSVGPILYLQDRVGLHGRIFKVIKFRSMRTDAERDGQPQWAAAMDDRVTRVGRLIRKLRIDELPQLFNVLRGDMSLVGPRPERPYFVDQLTQALAFYAVRHSVKPGITGWAQVRYHYGASVEDAAEKLQYDLYYVKHNTLFLDLVVLFETVGVVLTGKGAH